MLGGWCWLVAEGLNRSYRQGHPNRASPMWLGLPHNMVAGSKNKWVKAVLPFMIKPQKSHTSLLPLSIGQGY